ncbi:cache domain-containing sensor histidine kinase [Cohnella mopanensis]|uniref:cache domain-containing sensor histidine kinase n=1 Tax=Cohnella mopanensis TaxID=2911966 RepID=UPI001EF81B9F
MKWFRKYWNGIRLPHKLVLVYMPLIVIPTLLGSLMLMHSYTASSKEASRDYAADLVGLMVEQMDYRLSSIEELGKQMITDSELLDLVSRTDVTTFEQLDKTTAIKNWMNHYWLNNNMNEFIVAMVLDTGSEIYLYNENEVSQYRIRNPEYKQAVRNNRGGAVWFEPASFSNSFQKFEAFRVGRWVRDSKLNEVGILTIVIDVEAIRSIFNQTKLDENALIRLQTAEGRILVDNGNEGGDAGNYQDLHLDYSDIREDWALSASLKMDDLYAQINRMIRLTILIISVVFVFGLVVTRYLAIDVVNPIRKLMSNMMSGVQSASPRKLVKFKGAIEIREMNDIFVSVMYEIEQLIQQTVSQEQKKRAAEIEALRKQLSPHFLYNTLNSIRWLAILQKQSNIKALVESLSSLLNYTLRDANEFVNLREDAEKLEDYISIQKIRYRQFAYATDIGERTLNASVPKFIIQPIVENALIHGLEPLDRMGQITVRASIRGSVLKLTVEDNGIGIAPDKLAEIRQQLSGSAPQGTTKHIGILNVHERIVAHYGYPYGMSIDSEAGQGTTIEVTLKYEERSEDEYYHHRR